MDGAKKPKYLSSETCDTVTMDGLTVFQAMIGGMHVIKKIYDTAQSLRHAPDSIKDLISELSVTNRLIEQLQPLIIGNENINAGIGAQHVRLGDFVLVFTDLTKTLSRFDKFITRISYRNGIQGTTISKSSIWLKNKQKFHDDLTRLQYQKSSLTLMLALLER